MTNCYKIQTIRCSDVNHFMYFGGIMGDVTTELEEEVTLNSCGEEVLLSSILLEYANLRICSELYDQQYYMLEQILMQDFQIINITTAEVYNSPENVSIEQIREDNYNTAIITFLCSNSVKNQCAVTCA